MNPVLWGIVVCIVFLFYQYIVKEIPKNFPDGPSRLPYGGHYFLMRLMNFQSIHDPMQRFCQWYKKGLFGFYLFDFPCVIANGIDNIKQVLVRPEFQGRIEVYPSKLKTQGDKLGLFNNDGPIWLEQRRFMLRSMREFGFGCRNKNEEVLLMRETQEMVDRIAKCGAKEGIVIPDIFYPHAFNNAWSIIAGRRLPSESYEQLNKVVLGAADTVRRLDVSGNIITYLPWMRFFLPTTSGYKPLVSGQKVYREFVREEIMRHKESRIPGVNNDYIDYYLNKMEEDISAGKQTNFKVEELIVMIMDVFLPAIQTIPDFMSFVMVALLDNPEVQLKAQAEIDKVIGRDRLPTLDDRTNLPYVESIIRESLRYFSPTPMGLIRKTTEETELDGKILPEGTCVFQNMEALHMDSELWDKPEQFCPARMMKDGTLDLKADKSLPFGLGRRVCAGETFARQTMFVITAAILQNFTIWPLDPIPDKTKYKTAITRYLDPYKVKAVQRV